MAGLWRPVLGWIEERSGIPSAAERFFCEEIPASAGWPQVFGSVALFLLLVQAFTGVLLAFNYAPTPGDAYLSVRFIVTEVAGGKLIRGLHHWGASCFIVVVVLHMIQVFLYGAYKKPRELTWMAGVGLLLLALGFGLTGYLLPWDNRAYWGTVITTQIASQAPGVGPYLARALGGAGQVGVITFARFYSLHVLILPAAVVILVAFHVYLVRRHGITPQQGDEWAPKKRFYPQQIFKDTIAIFIAFAVLFLLAELAHVPLTKMADPSDTAFVPRPEWYFLFLFQLLKFFAGPFEVVGTVILPSLAILALILVPFAGRRRIEKLTKRIVAGSAVALGLAAWTGLTAAAIVTTPKQLPAVDYSGPTDWLQVSPAVLAGTETSAAARQAIPDFARKGAIVYQKKHCGSCHMVNGFGAAIGPPLNGLSSRRSETWIERHFSEPQQLSPGTIMPRFELAPDDMANLTAYLLSLEPR